MPQGQWIRLGEIMAHTKAIIDIRVILIILWIIKYHNGFIYVAILVGCGE